MSIDHLPNLSLTTPVTISAAAERFARRRGIMGSLAVMKGLVFRRAHIVDALRIDLENDPEVKHRSIVCFTVKTSAALKDVVDFDRALDAAIYEQIPPDHQIYFAARFEFT